MGSPPVIALFDSDVVIDLLGGLDAAWEEHARYTEVAISRITWIEAQIGARTDEVRALRVAFLAQFRIVELDSAVAQLTIVIRREHRLKLPDAIVWAAARHLGALLVTRNTKDFPRSEPSVRFPYEV